MSQALAELKDSTGDTSEEQAALTAELEKWKEELANAEAGQTAAERGVENWQQQLNKAKIELNETNEAISENDKYLDEAKKSTDGCATSIDKFGNKVKDSKDGITQLAAALAAAGVAKSVKEIADALMECSQAAAGFETALAKVSTLADTSVVSMDTIKAQLVSLSGETGVAVESLAEATYQALVGRAWTPRTWSILSLPRQSYPSRALRSQRPPLTSSRLPSMPTVSRARTPKRSPPCS